MIKNQKPVRNKTDKKRSLILQQVYTLKLSVYEKNLISRNIDKININDLELIRKGYPTEYIVKQTQFNSHAFYINENVLIPRAETEKIVYIATKSLKAQTRYHILDIGTGSGAIIISVAHFLTQNKQNHLYFFTATDISSEAIYVAKQNQKNICPNIEISFLKGNLIEPAIQNIKKTTSKGYKNIILANLPYLVPTTESQKEKSQLRYEPKTALFGKDGTLHYKQLFKQILQYFIDFEFMIIEVDAEQPDKFLSLCKKSFPDKKIEIINDFRDKKRFIKVE